MRLVGPQPGDLLLVDHKGRRFLAAYEGRDGDDLAIRPLARGVTWRTCTARQVVGHWRATKDTRDRDVRATL